MRFHKIEPVAAVFALGFAALISYGSGVGLGVSALVCVAFYFSLVNSRPASNRAARVRSSNGASDSRGYSSDGSGVQWINPTTGLPMVGNVAGGIDVGGHMWGENIWTDDSAGSFSDDSSSSFGSDY